jgi:hypothetical protein
MELRSTLLWLLAAQKPVIASDLKSALFTWKKAFELYSSLFDFLI